MREATVLVEDDGKDEGNIDSSHAFDEISFLSEKQQDILAGGLVARKSLDEMEQRLLGDVERIHQLNDSAKALKEKYNELREQRLTVKYTRELGLGQPGGDLEEVLGQGSGSVDGWIGPLAPLDKNDSHFDEMGHSQTRALIDAEAGLSDSTSFPGHSQKGLGLFGDQFGVITGTLPQKHQALLESVLWRALRGNLYLLMKQVGTSTNDSDDEDSSLLYKDAPLCVFVASAHGRHLIKKIKSLSEALGAHLYDVTERDDRALTASLLDVGRVLSSTLAAKRLALQAMVSYLAGWKFTLLKEKRIYHVLNMCSLDATRKCLLAEGWTLTRELGRLQGTLRQLNLGAILNALPIPEGDAALMPPTYHPVNKFTGAIQSIVDAYGVAQYREINPALFSLITFPFLFAVMFGDLGHGLLVTVFAAFLCFFERKIALWKQKNYNEMVEMVYVTRYPILLMGLFSIYMGLIYNDVFSRAIPLFPSAFTFYSNGTMSSYDANYVYPFGMDWAWVGSDNALLFVNSYKMKQAVFLGVIQMLFGIGLAGVNFYLRKDMLSFWSIFVPELIFMSAIFGYLNFMIVYKWITQIPSHAPSLLTMLIQMLLMPGNVTPDDEFYKGQAIFQLVLLFMAIISIPVMFLATPIAKNKARKQRQAEALALDPFKDNLMIPNTPSVMSSNTQMEEEHDSLVDDLVHSGIHTIEFILGAISNTASYLRLWALSLAHSQLSDVLWSMIVEYFGYSFVLGLLFFPAWLGATVLVLILMEGLSAFLHALRLHWVEFNSKFYKGDGRLFTPFHYKDLLKLEDL